MKSSAHIAMLIALFTGVGFTVSTFGYYNPTTGRWLSRDPVEESGGKNLYGFVHNDATGRVDPNGLEFYESQVHYYKPFFRGNMRAGETRGRLSVDAICRCPKTNFQIVFKHFWVCADTGVYVNRYATGDVLRGRPLESIQYVRKFEQNWREMYRAWHDQNEAQAKAELNTGEIYKQGFDCQTALKSITQKYEALFKKKQDEITDLDKKANQAGGAMPPIPDSELVDPYKPGDWNDFEKPGPCPFGPGLQPK